MTETSAPGVGGMDQHITLAQLKSPAEATDYVWASTPGGRNLRLGGTGDIAFAKCSQGLWAAAQEPMRNGWPTFKYALPREIDPAPMSDEVAQEMVMSTITLVIERFRHKERGERLGLRFATPKDQQLYLEAHPHLAVTEPLPSPPKDAP